MVGKDISAIIASACIQSAAEAEICAAAMLSGLQQPKLPAASQLLLGAGQHTCEN